MRDHSVHRLIGAAAVWVSLLAGPVAAQEPGVTVELETPESITEGARFSVVAIVVVSPAGDRPVIVTPTTEGTAVEVVRGRLLRADAEDPDAEVLRFRVPLVARRRGTGVVRVQVQGWACRDGICREVRAEARAVLRVAGP